jgi:methionyl-tRNA formyltransferase
MKPMSPTVLFFGNERLATGVTTQAPTLQALILAGYNVAAVIIAQESTSQSRNTRLLEIAQVARDHNIPVLAPAKLADIKNDLASYQASVGVLVAFGKFVPPSIINLFPRGIINIHPSLLPKHRGPTPLESAILDGDYETGVSLMMLAAEMDSGPIVAQETVLLRGNETKQALADQLLNLGKDMLIQYLPAILDGSLRAYTQASNRAHYDQRIAKDAGKLDDEAWKRPAAELERQIRAYAGWPRSRTKIGATDVIITSAHVAPGVGSPGTLWLEGRSLGVHAKDGILVIDSLIPAGKKEMSAAAFLAGYHLPPTS